MVVTCIKSLKNKLYLKILECSVQLSPQKVDYFFI